MASQSQLGGKLGLVRLPALVPKWLRDRMLCML